MCSRYNFTICISLCREKKSERDSDGFDLILYALKWTIWKISISRFDWGFSCSRNRNQSCVYHHPSIGHVQLSNSNAFWLLLPLLYLNTINFDYLFQTFTIPIFIVEQQQQQQTHNSNSIRVHFENYFICIKLTLFHLIPMNSPLQCWPFLSANQRMETHRTSSHKLWTNWITFQ